MLLTGLPSISWTTSPGIDASATVDLGALEARGGGARALVHLADQHALDSQPARHHGAQAVVEVDADHGPHHAGRARSARGTMRLTVSTGTAKPMPADAPDGL